MSRDQKRPARAASPPESTYSSRSGSISSHFERDDSGVMSTRRSDGPELHDSPKMNYELNEAALDRVFPNFSQGGESSRESSLSIEVGRGQKKNRQPTQPAQPAKARAVEAQAYSSDRLFSLGSSARRPSRDFLGQFNGTSSPPALAQPTCQKNEPKQRDPQKKSPVKQSAPPKKENIRPAASTVAPVSRPFHQSSGENRRTLSYMHARVVEEDDSSLISDERPATMDLTARSTRFGRANTYNVPTARGRTHGEASRPGVSPRVDLRNNPSGSVVRHSKGSEVMSNGPAGEQSFVLPDLPNLSELVSVVYQQSTPALRSHRQSGGRFSSANPYHPGVDGMPLPVEERALFASLQILQDRVAELETEKVGSERTIEQLQSALALLNGANVETERRRRADSAVGMADSGSDSGQRSGKYRNKLMVENTKLAIKEKSLQERLDKMTRKLSLTEMNMRNLIQERDTAIAELRVAYSNVDELKQENEKVVAQVEALGEDLGHLKAAFEAERRKTAKNEAAARERHDVNHAPAAKELRHMTRDIRDRRETTSHSDAGAVRPERQSSKTRPLKSRAHNRGAHQVDEPSHAPRALQVTAESEELGQSGTSQPVSAPNPYDSLLVPRTRPVASNQPSKPAEQDQPKKKRTRTVIVEETIHSDMSDGQTVDEADARSVDNDDRASENDESVSNASETGRMTCLSALDLGEVAKLRRRLEQERAQRHNADRAAVEFDDQDRVINMPEDYSRNFTSGEQQPWDQVQETNGDADDEHTGKFSVKAGENTDQFAEELDTPDESRRATVQTTVEQPAVGTRPVSKASRRRQPPTETTSAFILPDITIRDSSNATRPALSAKAQHVLDGLAHHERDGCTVCRRVSSQSKGTSQHPRQPKERVKILRPIPVSQRMPEPEPYEDEPTIRPSQPPISALAAVMKAMEDELAHLKMEHAQCQAAYNELDVSLAKHKRKSLRQQTEMLLKAIDTKADQIYALYDVLEGQRDDAQEMTEDQMEMTLNSIGLNFPEGRRASDQSKPRHTSKPKGKRGVDSDSSDGEDLPWEGVEETMQSSRAGRFCLPRRHVAGQ